VARDWRGKRWERAHMQQRHLLWNQAHKSGRCCCCNVATQEGARILNIDIVSNAQVQSGRTQASSQFANSPASVAVGRVAVKFCVSYEAHHTSTVLIRRQYYEHAERGSRWPVCIFKPIGNEGRECVRK
jgi:hypothetical protein